MSVSVRRAEADDFEAVAGIVIVSTPDIGVGTLALLIGIGFILRGLGMCALGWALREIRESAATPTHDPGAGLAA